MKKNNVNEHGCMLYLAVFHCGKSSETCALHYVSCMLRFVSKVTLCLLGKNEEPLQNT